MFQLLPFRSRQPALAIALLTCAACWAAPSVELIDIGPGFPTDLSADGSTVVGQKISDFATFRWTASTGMVGLGRSEYVGLQGQISGQPAVSADGSVVASTIIDVTGTHGTEGLWTQAGGWQQLTPPLPPDGGILDREDSSVYGMSRDGKTVTGLYWRPGQQGGSAHGSVWTAATQMIGLPTDGGSARIDDANADGSVMSGWEEAADGHRQATVWVGGVKTILDTSAWPSEAERLNSAGTIVVGQSHNFVHGRNEAALWQWNGSSWDLRLLGVLASGNQKTSTSYANGVSDDGSIVVGFDAPNSFGPTSRGMIWTAASGMVSAGDWLLAQGVNLKGRFSISNVVGISADGNTLLAVGNEVNPPHATHALLIRRLAAAGTH